MMITMRGISNFIAESLNTNAEYIALSSSLMSETFNYFVNVDLATVDVVVPYFGIVTFEDKDDKEVKKAFQTQLLIGINRLDPVTTNKITEEPTLDSLEQLGMKALEVISKDLRIFGIQGDTNIKISYINMYVPNPDGEDDLQMQIDIELEQERFLSC